MKIVSCIKQVYDLDMVLEDDWQVDATHKSVDIHYANRIMNSYDEANLELMCKLKDKNSNIMTKAITIGNKESESLLYKALAIGVDSVSRIDVADSDIHKASDNATLIYELLKDDNSIDLILCGKQSDIKNYGQTGQILAEKLAWPCFSNVYEIECNDEVYRLKRLLNDGTEEVLMKGPLVVTVIPASNQFLRMPTLRDMITAKKKEIEVLDSKTSLSIIQSASQENELTKITIDKPNKQCQYLETTETASLEDQLLDLIQDCQRSGGGL